MAHSQDADLFHNDAKPINFTQVLPPCLRLDQVLKETLCSLRHFIILVILLTSSVHFIFIYNFSGKTFGRHWFDSGTDRVDILSLELVSRRDLAQASFKYSLNKVGQITVLANCFLFEP